MEWEGPERTGNAVNALFVPETRGRAELTMRCHTGCCRPLACGLLEEEPSLITPAPLQACRRYANAQSRIGPDKMGQTQTHNVHHAARAPVTDDNSSSNGRKGTTLLPVSAWPRAARAPGQAEEGASTTASRQLGLPGRVPQHRPPHGAWAWLRLVLFWPNGARSKSLATGHGLSLEASTADQKSESLRTNSRAPPATPRERRRFRDT